MHLLSLLAQGPSGKEIERALEKVFSEPGFRWSSHVGQQSESWWIPLLEKLYQLWKKLNLKLEFLKESSPTLFWILFAILLLIALLLIIHIGRTLAMGMRFAFAKPVEEVTEKERSRRLHSGELKAQARKCAEQGLGAEAIRLLLLSLLAFLEEKRILTVAGGWTNRELFRHLEKKLHTAREWRPFEERIEEVSYAGHPLSLPQYSEIEASLEALLEGKKREA